MNDNAQTPDYSIAPEDQALADSISNFDPVHDVPSPASFTGGELKAPEGPLSAAMLPPELRSKVEDQLRTVPQNIRVDRENDLVREALYQNSLELRIKAGVGKEANAFVKERFLIASERNQASQELLRIADQLTKVDRWVPVYDENDRPVIDPATGQPKVNAEYFVTGEHRTALERKIGELNHKVELLDGPEGDLREKRALHRAVQEAKAQADEIAINQEARKRADEMLRDEKVAAKAELFAKSRRSSF